MIRRESGRIRIAHLMIAMMMVASLLAAWFVHRPTVGESVGAGTSSLIAHSPIAIDGDGGFTNASGVTRGSGVSSDPYVIEGWEINVSAMIAIDGIRIYDTTAFFVIKNVYVHSNTNAANSGIQLHNVAHALILDSTLANAVAGLNCPSYGTDITVSNCTFEGCDCVMYITEDVEVLNCHFSSNDAGFQCRDSANVSIHDNTFQAPNVSLDIYNTSNCEMSRNTIGNCSVTGVRISASSDVTVQDSLIGLQVAPGTSPTCGVQIDQSTRVSLLNNRILSNPAQNIVSWGFSASFSDHLDMIGNRVVQIGGMFAAKCTNIAAYHNSFVNNLAPTDLRDVDDSKWDAGYPSGGNFWSDYRPEDKFSGLAQDVAGPDGIGDIAQFLDSSNKDRYPLMTDFLVPNTIPQASFALRPLVGDTSTTYRLDATSSRDNETLLNGLQLRWDFDGGGSWDTNWSTDLTTTHRFSSPGNYTVKLEVRDGGNLTSQYASIITVNERDDIVTILLVAAGIVCVVGVIAALLVLRKRGKGRNPA